MKKQPLLAPPFTVDQQSGVIRLQGEWSIARLAALEKELALLRPPPKRELVLEGSRISGLDTAGAMLLHRLRAELRTDGKNVSLQGFQTEHLSLYELVAEHAPAELPQPDRTENRLELIGRHAIDSLRMTTGFLSFVGRNSVILLELIRHPGRFRWRSMGYHIESTGLQALPIIGLLTFLIGIVIAYQGGVQLQQYGASIYITDLVGLSVTREFAPLITAILVAGRTGSAFAAQLATMQVNEEVDAVRVLGIDPLEILVLPKLLALLVVMPLLTIYADIMGVLGGMVMANAMLDVSSVTFLERFPDAVSAKSYLSGIGKAPVFAGIIALVGCYQGLSAAGSAESVGLRTTVSVVQSIFLIIIADALFSILFSWLGI